MTILSTYGDNPDHLPRQECRTNPLKESFYLTLLNNPRSFRAWRRKKRRLLEQSDHAERTGVPNLQDRAERTMRVQSDFLFRKIPNGDLGGMGVKSLEPQRRGPRWVA